MAKLILMNKTEIAVTEDKKGKQLAVKENNITSMKEFYKKNYQIPVGPDNITSTPDVIESSIEPVVNNVVNEEPQIENIPVNNIIEEQPVITPVVGGMEENQSFNSQQNSESVIDIATTPIVEETLSTEDNNENAGGINLTPDNAPILEESEEDLDPELKEIKERLDKVIEDLNNYKKKIKILENEVNQNLEKSKEVLKDTQAAAEIMSIQQARQRQISEEVGASNPAEDETSRLLQKETA